MKSRWLPLLILVTGCTAPRGESWLQTTGGAWVAAPTSVILPHEHIFTDLRGPETPGYGQADAEDVMRVMKPLLAEVKRQGVDALVECTTIGVGRNVPLMARLARETGLHIIVPTGVYGRAHYAPQAYRDMTEVQLTQWMVREIRQGIESTGIKAGFIKTATGGKRLNPLEEKFFRASIKAAAKTGVIIASHTPTGTAAVQQADIRDELGLEARLIWVHAQAEPDSHYHLELAARGLYIELDSLGAPAEDDRLITLIHQLITAGYVDRILLSHDAGWYHPGQPNGGQQRPYTYLLQTFVPKLRNSGLDERTIQRLISENPRRAFGLNLR